MIPNAICMQMDSDILTVLLSTLTFHLCKSFFMYFAVSRSNIFAKFESRMTSYIGFRAFGPWHFGPKWSDRLQLSWDPVYQIDLCATLWYRPKDRVQCVMWPPKGRPGRVILSRSETQKPCSGRDWSNHRTWILWLKCTALTSGLVL